MDKQINGIKCFTFQKWIYLDKQFSTEAQTNSSVEKGE